jgi:hypothetical protein
MDPNQQPPLPDQGPSNQLPQSQTSYGVGQPQMEYDPSYLDSIAPTQAHTSFLSGTFGKLFWVLLALFVLGVSLIIAFSGKDDTTDLQQIAVRLDNFSRTTKAVHKNLKSNNLLQIDGTFELWIAANKTAADDLLKKGGVSKTEYNREMVKSEKAYAAALDAKYEDARLAAKLNRVYANSMSAEAEKLVNMLNTMSKKSKSKQIRDYAKSARDNLASIQKNFDDYNDDGN